MAKPVCSLSVWKDEKGKQRKLKMHKCDRTCAMAQAECMELVRTQGFHMPWDDRRHIVSKLVKREWNT